VAPLRETLIRMNATGFNLWTINKNYTTLKGLNDSIKKENIIA
jgi:hypothetical protein